MLCSDPCLDLDSRVAKEDSDWMISVTGQTWVCPNWYEQGKTGSHIANWFLQPPTPNSRVRYTSIPGTRLITLISYLLHWTTVFMPMTDNFSSLLSTWSWASFTSSIAVKAGESKLNSKTVFPSLGIIVLGLFLTVAGANLWDLYSISAKFYQ